MFYGQAALKASATRGAWPPLVPATRAWPPLAHVMWAWPPLAPARWAVRWRKDRSIVVAVWKDETTHWIPGPCQQWTHSDKSSCLKCFFWCTFCGFKGSETIYLFIYSLKCHIGQINNSILSQNVVVNLKYFWQVLYWYFTFLEDCLNGCESQDDCDVQKQKRDSEIEQVLPSWGAGVEVARRSWWWHAWALWVRRMASEKRVIGKRRRRRSVPVSRTKFRIVRL